MMWKSLTLHTDGLETVYFVAEECLMAVVMLHTGLETVYFAAEGCLMDFAVEGCLMAPVMLLTENTIYSLR